MFTRNKNSVADLANQLQSLSGARNYDEDLTEWKLTTDKAGNGNAIIRILPAKGIDGELVPITKIYNHAFKTEGGRWFIENCPTTIGRDDCPVCIKNSEDWNAGPESLKDAARGRKRKMSYWANIVVIKDENNPESVGNVYRWRFGKKIFEKIMSAAAPEMEEETPIDVTDVFEGANFFLKCKKVGGFANYDDSKFGPQSELFGGDKEQLDKVFHSMHSLKEITDASQFKSAAELQKAFGRAAGENARREEAINREVQEARAETTRYTPETQSDSDDIPFDVDSSTVTDEIDDFLKSLDS